MTETCPLPGCENLRGAGKTGGCSKSHANRLAAAARTGRPPRPETPAPEPGATCPMPGCENGRGPGKTGGCCLAHASKLAWGVRAGRAPQPDPPPVRAPRPPTKKQQLAEQLRLTERHGLIAEALRQREARIQAAYRAHR
jgi:hypothetical protein